VTARFPVPAVAFAGAFAAADMLIDRILADHAGTYHHARPLLLVIPAVTLAALLWATRSQLGRWGRAGALLTLAGALGNAASLVADPAGVSDYLAAQIGRYLLVGNIADLAILAGLVLVLASALRVYAVRAARRLGIAAVTRS
jgi:lipoprotein signal peptidase